MTGDLSDTVPLPITQIDSPDQKAQYRDALSLVKNRILSASASSMPSTGPSKSIDAKQSAEFLAGMPVVAEWFLVSVWRQAILRTSDDRRPDKSSQIMKDLAIWDKWLQEKHVQIVQEKTRYKQPVINAYEKIGMVSIPLIEGTSDSNDYRLVEQEARRSGWNPALIQLIPDLFDHYQKVVDSVSEDMAASHLLWIFQKGVPVFQVIHHAQTGGDARSLTGKLDGLLNFGMPASPDSVVV